MKQIHVFIADISVVCREGLKQIFRAYDWISISGEANETAELLQLLPLVKCDVILTEIDFKQKGEGLEACRTITELYPGKQVIFFTFRKDNCAVVSAMRAGARAYIAKDSATNDIVDQVKAVCKGRGFFLGETIPKYVFSEALEQQQGSKQRPFQLTEREIEIIECLALGLSTKQTAEKLCINPSTVDSHKEHIKEKLHLNNVVEIVAFAFRHHLLSID